MNLKKLLPFALLGAVSLSSCLEDNPDYAVGTPSPIASIEDIRRLYQGENVPLQPDLLAGAHQIVGVIVSDATGLNVPGGTNTIVVQNKHQAVAGPVGQRFVAAVGVT